MITPTNQKATKTLETGYKRLKRLKIKNGTQRGEKGPGLIKRPHSQTPSKYLITKNNHLKYFSIP